MNLRPLLLCLVPWFCWSFSFSIHAQPGKKLKSQRVESNKIQIPLPDNHGDPFKKVPFRLVVLDDEYGKALTAHANIEHESGIRISTVFHHRLETELPTGYANLSVETGWNRIPVQKNLKLPEDAIRLFRIKKWLDKKEMGLKSIAFCPPLSPTDTLSHSEASGADIIYYPATPDLHTSTSTAEGVRLIPYYSYSFQPSSLQLLVLGMERELYPPESLNDFDRCCWLISRARLENALTVLRRPSEPIVFSDRNISPLPFLLFGECAPDLLWLMSEDDKKALESARDEGFILPAVYDQQSNSLLPEPLVLFSGPGPSPEERLRRGAFFPAGPAYIRLLALQENNPEPYQAGQRIKMESETVFVNSRLSFELPPRIGQGAVQIRLLHSGRVISRLDARTPLFTGEVAFEGGRESAGSRLQAELLLEDGTVLRSGTIWIGVKKRHGTGARLHISLSKDSPADRKIFVRHSATLIKRNLSPGQSIALELPLSAFVTVLDGQGKTLDEFPLSSLVLETRFQAAPPLIPNALPWIESRNILSNLHLNLTGHE